MPSTQTFRLVVLRLAVTSDVTTLDIILLESGD